VLEFFKGPFVLAQAEAGEVERVFARIEAGLEGAQQ
jgi:hypothetical protein